MTTIGKIEGAMCDFHRLCYDPKFSSLLKKETLTERKLANPLRWFLRGRFSSALPEVSVRRTKIGRPHQVDFRVGNVAVEVAVRPRGRRIDVLKSIRNKTEVKKLIRFSGKSLLVLLDFESERSQTVLESYDDFLPHGRVGAVYHVLYIFRTEGDSGCQRLRVAR